MYQETKVKNRKSATLLTHLFFVANFIKKTHLIYDVNIPFFRNIKRVCQKLLLFDTLSRDLSKK